MSKRKFTGNCYQILQNKTATLTGNDYFHTFNNGTVAQTVEVKGGGIFESVAADSGTGTHLDSSGIVLGDTHAAGFYEAVGTQSVSMDLAINQVVCGRFTEIKCANTTGVEVYAYTG